MGMSCLKIINGMGFSIFAHFVLTGYASILRREAEDSCEKLVPYYKKSHSRDHNPSRYYHLVLSFHYYCPFLTSV
jgi:hypothetical protein